MRILATAILLMLAACGKEDTPPADTTLPELPAPPPKSTEFVFNPATFLTNDHLTRAGFPAGTTAQLEEGSPRGATYAVGDLGLVFVYVHAHEGLTRKQFKERMGVRIEELRGWQVDVSEDASMVSYVAAAKDGSGVETGRTSRQLSVIVRLQPKSASGLDLRTLATTLCRELAP